MKTLFNKRFDISGNEMSRVVKLNLLSRIFPLGNFSGGPGGRPSLVLFIVHYFGKPVFRILISQEDRVHQIYTKIRRRV